MFTAGGCPEGGRHTDVPHEFHRIEHDMGGAIMEGGLGSTDDLPAAETLRHHFRRLVGDTPTSCRRTFIRIREGTDHLRIVEPVRRRTGHLLFDTIEPDTMAKASPGRNDV